MRGGPHRSIVAFLLAAILLILPVGTGALISTAPTGQKAWYWQNPRPQGNDLFGVTTAGNRYVWAVGTPGVVLYSNDAGANWISQDPNTQVQLRAVDFVDENRGWLVGLGGTIRATADGGSTWVTQTSGTTLNLYGVEFADPSTGWAVGQTGAIRATANGGASWVAQASGTTAQLNSVSAVSPTRAWAVGAAATILRTVNGSTWTIQPPPANVTVALNGVDFPSENVGYAVGNSGTIIKTTDGGATWTTLTSGTTQNLLSVAFVDVNTGWVVGAAGQVLYTVDGGATWSPTQHAGTIQLNSVAVFDAQNAQAVGNTGTMLRTTDAGASWSSQMPGTTLQINDISFVDEQTGWAVGASGLVMKTTDGGWVWDLRSVGGATTWMGVHFVDRNNGWVVGSAGRIRRTTDGGKTWVVQNSGTTQQLNSVFAVTSQLAYAVGSAGVAIKTVDGGATWTPLNVGVTTGLNDVFFVDANTGWAVGAGSVIRKTTNGGATWVAQTLGATSTLQDVFFVDTNQGVVVGSTNNVIRYTTNGGTTWLAATNPAGAYNAVVMTDASRGWAVGNAGVVVRTTNGGITWTAQNSQATGNLLGVSAVNPNVGWLAGAGGTIRLTTDGGTTWMNVTYGTTSQLNAVSLVDALTGFTVGNTGAILRTTNGIDWAVLPSGTTSNLLGVDFISPTRGWAVGAAGTIRATTNGSTWVGQTSGTTNQINAVDFVDENNGWYAANGAVLGRTNNGGSTWSIQSAPVDSSVALNGISFADANTGWAVGGAAGQPAAVLKTVDGGSTWAVQSTSLPTGRILRAVFAIDPQTAWAVGDTGTLIRTVNGGTTWTTVATGLTAQLWDIHFEDANHGWLVGALSGSVSVIRRTTDGGATWVTQNPGTARTLRAVDFAGIDQGVIVGLSGTILRTTDSSAPETTMTLEPPAPDGRNGWYITPPEVTLSVNEPAITYYSLNAASGPWYTYSLPFVHAHEGTTTIAFYSIDPGGNRETTRTAIIKHDRGAPTTPTALAASVTSTTVELTWAPSHDATSGVDYYEVLREGSVVGTSAVSAFTLTGLTPETETTLTVRAYDVAGNVSGESDPVRVFTLAALPRPPAIVFARVAYRNEVHLNWGETTGTVSPVAYRIYRSLNGEAYSAVATVTVGYPGSWEDTTLVAPVVAAYRVSVLDARGEGPMSAETTATVCTLTTLPSPRRFRAEATRDGVEMSWDSLPGAAEYVLYRAITSTATPSYVTSPSVPATSFVDTSVAHDTGYWYRIAAIDASGTVGSTSTPVFVSTLSEESTDSPHGEYDPFTDDCALCHRAHSSANLIALLSIPGDNEIQLCLSCHDGTSAPDVLDDFSAASMAGRHPVAVDGSSTVLTCSQCHTAHNERGGPELGKLLRTGPDRVRSGNAICYSCHGASGTDMPRGDLTVFEGSGHRASVPAPPDGVGVVCLACHEGHATWEPALVPYSGYERCLWCHSASYSLPGAADIARALSGSGSDTRHDLIGTDQVANGSMITCANCHEPHVSSPGTPTVDPDQPTTAAGWTGSMVDFCLRCHDVELPTSAQTTGWALPPLGPGGVTSVSNIASSWPNSVHGESTGSPLHLRSDMGYAPGSVLPCNRCHDPHGSSNRWALAESVTASGGAITLNGLAVVPAGTGADLRFFCGACHVVGPSTHPGIDEGGADLRQWPINCTQAGCHNHSGMGL